MRPINDISKNKDVVIVEPSYNLTDSEIEALCHIKRIYELLGMDYR